VTLPVGSALPSGAECAARVRPAAEVRSVNTAANNNRGSRANANNRNDWNGFDRVDGNFAGTTDELIQWAACKWGIDEDIARAQIAKESWWHQSANGDNGESWGLGQVRDTAHQSAFEYAINARTSSAYNLDYTYAAWRACYEGVLTWLNNVERGKQYSAGDADGCLGVWFSGRWYTQPATTYIAAVNDYKNQRIWETQNFKNG
jgi:autotransporter family porin